MSLYFGVDPGLKGAIAVLDAHGAVLGVRPMPLVPGGRAGRDQFDLPAIRDLIAGVGEGAPRFVTVEKAQPMPRSMGGGAANFARGLARGFEWLLVGLGIPYLLVAPREWQRAMHTGTPGGDTKQRSIVAAQRLFPGVDLTGGGRKRTATDGIAEALLQAEYGRRVRLGLDGQKSEVA